VIRDRHIVCIASNWFDHPTSKHHIMRVLSRHNHVLWINFHASRRPQLTRRDAGLALRRLRQVWSGARRVTPGIDVLSPLLVPLPRARLARFVNARWLVRQIRAHLGRLPARPVQLWLFTPDIPEIVGPLQADRVVYYCVDDFAAFSGFNTRLMERLERQTMAASDVIITTSSSLYEERRGRHPRVHLVPHGVDFDHFAAAARLPVEAVPADLRAIRRPVFGFMGMIGDYVDLELIVAAARARPDWSFVLMGQPLTDVSPVKGLPNVHLLGGRPYEQLPAYCRGFDVGLIPFRMSRLVRAVNPIKLREYLAAGLPVVSAPMEAVRPYAPAVQTAQTLDEFLPACQAALALAAASRQAEIQELVRGESWRSRVEWLSELIEPETDPPNPPTVQAKLSVSSRTE
jgi:glycosyltransferase involved in cell wall biosynthesis